MDAAIAGLFGAVVGASSSLVTVWIQAHYQAKRERAKAVLDFAIRHRSEAFEYADKIAGPVAVTPLAAHVHYQQGLLKLIETNTLTAEALEKLHSENDDISQSIQDAKQARVVAKVMASHNHG